MTGRPVAVLLRAVNLAGRRLTMTDFRSLLDGAGFAGARTLGASGNAVITAPGADPALEARIEKAFEGTFCATPEVFVRDGRALGEVIAANPYAETAEREPDRLLVMFLKGEPRAADVAALQARIAGPEEVAAGPGCLFARYPDGIGRSKLTGAVIERALKLRGTGRNWNTVGKLAGMLSPP